jgi:hypothetical protein
MSLSKLLREIPSEAIASLTREIQDARDESNGAVAALVIAQVKPLLPLRARFNNKTNIDLSQYEGVCVDISYVKRFSFTMRYDGHEYTLSRLGSLWMAKYKKETGRAQNSTEPNVWTHTEFNLGDDQWVTPDTIIPLVVRSFARSFELDAMISWLYYARNSSSSRVQAELRTFLFVNKEKRRSTDEIDHTLKKQRRQPRTMLHKDKNKTQKPTKRVKTVSTKPVKKRVLIAPPQQAPVLCIPPFVEDDQECWKESDPEDIPDRVAADLANMAHLANMAANLDHSLDVGVCGPAGQHDIPLSTAFQDSFAPFSVTPLSEVGLLSLVHDSHDYELLPSYPAPMIVKSFPPLDPLYPIEMSRQDSMDSSGFFSPLCSSSTASTPRADASSCGGLSDFQLPNLQLPKPGWHQYLFSAPQV